MDTILFLAFSESDGSLAKPALEALGAAVAMGGPIAVGLIGASIAAASRQVAGCGAARFLGVSGEEFGQSRYSTDAAAAEALARAAGATIVIAPASARTNRALPGVAYRLDGAIDTHVTRRLPTARPSRAGIIASAWKPPSAERAGPGSCCSKPAATRPGAASRARHPSRAWPSPCRLCEPPSPAFELRNPVSRPSGPTHACCSSPAPAGPRSRPMASRIRAMPKS